MQEKSLLDFILEKKFYHKKLLHRVGNLTERNLKVLEAFIPLVMYLIDSNWGLTFVGIMTEMKFRFLSFP